jgi:hypothetical protein
MDAGATRIRVPIAAAVTLAWRSVLLRPGTVLDVGWLPLLAMLAALLVPDLVGRYLLPGRGWVAGDAGALLDAVTGLLALNAFAVRWHWLRLTGDVRSLPRRLFLRAWLRFILYTVAMGAVGVVFFAVLWYAGLAQPQADDAATAIAAAIAGSGAVALSLAVARVSLLFPAAAFGEPLGLAAGWRAMGGNSWRLFLSSFMAVLPFLLVLEILLGQLLLALHLGPDVALAQKPPLGFVLLNGVVESVSRLVLTAMSASILSEFYRRIVLQRRERQR